MEYTYKEYEGILQCLTNHGYTVKGYGESRDSKKK